MLTPGPPRGAFWDLEGLGDFLQCKMWSRDRAHPLGLGPFTPFFPLILSLLLFQPTLLPTGCTPALPGKSAVPTPNTRRWS